MSPRFSSSRDVPRNEDIWVAMLESTRERSTVAATSTTTGNTSWLPSSRRPCRRSCSFSDSSLAIFPRSSANSWFPASVTLCTTKLCVLRFELGDSTGPLVNQGQCHLPMTSVASPCLLSFILGGLVISLSTSKSIRVQVSVSVSRCQPWQLEPDGG